MRAGWTLLLLAGCPASRPEKVAGPEPRPEPAPPPGTAVPVAEPPDPPPRPDPPAECAGRTWRDCGAYAEALVAGTATDGRAGMMLYRALCEAGDAHGCFESQYGSHPWCTQDDVAAACYALGLLYEAGRASCPVELDCAAALYEMACRGDDPDACTALDRLAAEERP